MTQLTLQEYLASRIVSVLQAESPDPVTDSALAPRFAMRGSPPDEQTLLPHAMQIAESLVHEAVRSGLPLMHIRIENLPLGGGSTAEVVEQVILHAPFVFKLDTRSKKLADEALAMRAIKNDHRLPEHFRAAWPTIYAVRQQSPFAYLMEIYPKEDGWSSLEDLLYPRDSRHALSVKEALQIGSSVLDLMFEGFEGSIDTRSVPNLDTDYVSRIGDRLRQTAAVDTRFAPRTLLVHGKKLRPWSEYLALLERHKDVLDRITPAFSTVAHGDPNPGNLMLRLASGTSEIKFIDPKEWVTGDYLFDVAKLTHFLEATGPVEKPVVPGTVTVSYVEQGTEAALTYQYRPAEWTEPLVQACYAHAGAFAAAHGDAHWEARYELAMASNLLGLPLGRLTHLRNPRPESALILYAEGLNWLDRFCARLEGAGSVRSSFVSYGAPTDIEPLALKKVRAHVVTEVPGVRSSTDHRGFQLLHWPPTRQNARGKPQELSLEHEARLKPGSEQGLQQLLQNLHASRDRPLNELVLQGPASFGDLHVSRHDRAAGPQSVDHYYEVAHPAAHGRLIPRMYTLRRRLRTSDFMTWSRGEQGIGEEVARERSSAEQPAPLNLELPFVALGTTGMTARLEFNWIDLDTIALAEALDKQLPLRARMNNPIYLASLMEGASFEGAAAVIEHTTFREKFTFLNPAGEKVFALNVDRITAQALATGRMGSYVDVDISSYRSIDGTELKSLTAFCVAIAEAYGLVPNLCTKAWRDALVVGLLES